MNDSEIARFLTNCRLNMSYEMHYLITKIAWSDRESEYDAYFCLARRCNDIDNFLLGKNKMNVKTWKLLENGDPDPEACRFLGNYFLGLEGCTLDFAKETECGTVACHAGHAIPLYKSLCPSDSDEIDYRWGELAIGIILGFNRPFFEVINWARNNPGKWGSDFGSLMFTSVGYIAFKNDIDMTVQEIGQWWIDVGDRIAEANKK